MHILSNRPLHSDSAGAGLFLAAGVRPACNSSVPLSSPGHHISLGSYLSVPSLQVIITEQGALLVRPGPLELRMHLRLLPGMAFFRLQITIKNLGTCIRAGLKGQSSNARLRKPAFLPHLESGSMRLLIASVLAMRCHSFWRYQGAYRRTITWRPTIAAWPLCCGRSSPPSACRAATQVCLPCSQRGFDLSVSLPLCLDTFCLAACGLLPLLHICRHPQVLLSSHCRNHAQAFPWRNDLLVVCVACAAFHSLERRESFVNHSDRSCGDLCMQACSSCCGSVPRWWRCWKTPALT